MEFATKLPFLCPESEKKRRFLHDLIPAGSVKIDDINIGDSFISVATSDAHKGERALYIKVDMFAYIAKCNPRAWPDSFCYAVNLASGHIRKFNKDFLVEPCPNACVTV